MSKVINNFISEFPRFRKGILFLIIALVLAPVDSYITKISKALSTAVYATVETTPTVHTGDSADDSAIWIHPANPSLSIIIGTDKNGSLDVYDLSGAVLQRIPIETNNVDLRYNFPLGANGWRW
jgi:3-phytase